MDLYTLKYNPQVHLRHYSLQWCLHGGGGGMSPASILQYCGHLCLSVLDRCDITPCLRSFCSNGTVGYTCQVRSVATSILALASTNQNIEVSHADPTQYQLVETQKSGLFYMGDTDSQTFCMAQLQCLPPPCFNSRATYHWFTPHLAGF